MTAGAQRRRPAIWRVVLAVLAFHAVWIGIYLGSGGDIRDFIKIGPGVVRDSHASTVIRYDPTYRYITPRDQSNHGGGYDGQFYYYIALDPARAHYYIQSPDSASYRYERILYPMLARFTALEQPAAIPWTLLLINLLACGGGVAALAAWLRRRGSSPWFAVIYGLYPGMLIALQFDLTEPLAYGLVALAIYLFDFGGRRGVIASGVAFGLAGLTRETTLLFAILFGLSILAGRANAASRNELRPRVIQAALFVALACLPFLIWIAVDYSWLGVPHTTSILDPVPFRGIFSDPYALTRQPLEAIFVGLPALLISAWMVPQLAEREGRLERLCMIANTLMIVVFSSGAVWASYTSIGRVAIAIVLGAVLCVPYLPTGVSAPQALCRWPPRLGATTVIGVAVLLWMALLPGVIYYGFSQKRLPPARAAGLIQSPTRSVRG